MDWVIIFWSKFLCGSMIQNTICLKSLKPVSHTLSLTTLVYGVCPSRKALLTTSIWRLWECSSFWKKQHLWSGCSTSKALWIHKSYLAGNILTPEQLTSVQKRAALQFIFRSLCWNKPTYKKKNVRIIQAREQASRDGLYSQFIRALK